MKFLVCLIFIVHLSALVKGSFAAEDNGLLEKEASSTLPMETVLSDEVNTVPKEDIEILAEAELEEDVIMGFLIREVIPAFGGFQDILSSKPSFEIYWTPEGMQIKQCSFKFQLKQQKTIRYNLADIQLYGFHSNAEIGGPEKLLFIELLCTDADSAEDIVRFKVKFFATDEALNPSYYSFKMTTMDKEQFDLKLNSIELGVGIENIDDVLISDSYGHIVTLPQDSPFLNFFEEEKAYAEATLDDEDESKNMYDVPLNLWNQIKEASFENPRERHFRGSESLVEGVDSSNGESLIPLRKLNLETNITLTGSAEILLPVYREGVKEDVPAVIPITGNVFSSVNGDLIPVINVSIQ